MHTTPQHDQSVPLPPAEVGTHSLSAPPAPLSPATPLPTQPRLAPAPTSAPSPVQRRLTRARWQQAQQTQQPAPLLDTVAPNHALTPTHQQPPRAFPAPAWLNTLVPTSLGDFEATADLDRRLSALAVRAQQRDAAARDELLHLLAYKVARFHLRVLRRARAFATSAACPIDAEDLAQEAWLVFTEVLHSWKPLPDTGPTPAPRGFVYYFLRVFPLRLQDRVTAARRAARLTTTAVPLDLLVEDEHSAPQTSLELDVQTALLLQDIAARIDPADLRLVLEHRARPHGSPLPTREHGMSRRTYYRRLAHITTRLRHLT